MKAPLFVRELRPGERETLEANLRSKDAFTLRRSQILWASTEWQTATLIAAQLKCASQTVRNALHAFEARGTACLQPGSTVPLSVEPVLTTEKREHLQSSCTKVRADHAGRGGTLGHELETSETLDRQS